MLKDWRNLLLFGLAAFFVLWMRWWASSGFPLEGQINETAEAAKDHESYNIFFYSAWQIGRAVDHWSALVTAIATAFIAGFTYTLWKATTGTLKATQDSIQLARDEFLSTHRPEMRLKHIWLTGESGRRLFAVA
jgi:hypothetical protein